MGYTDQNLEWAIKTLKQQGHVIDGNGQPAVGDEGMTFTVDGRRVGTTELYRMATPPAERFQFEADGKVCEIHYYFVRGGAEYDVYQDGRKISERQPTEEYFLDCVQRVANSMGGTNLRNIG